MYFKKAILKYISRVHEVHELMRKHAKLKTFNFLKTEVSVAKCCF